MSYAIPISGIGCGLTKENHEFISEDGKRYIDTPGLADPLIREQAAMNIEAALKKETNYKIVFVIALNDGRMKSDDIETINSIIQSVSVEFNYGLIFNKVSKNVLKFMDSDNMKLCLGLLKRQTESKFIIPFIPELFEAENKLLQDEIIRDGVIEFVNQIKPNLILEENVTPIDTRNFDERVSEIQTEVSKLMEEEKQLRLKEEEKRVEAEKRREEEEKMKVEAEKARLEAIRQSEEQERLRLEEERIRIEKEQQLLNSIVRTEAEYKVEITNERFVHREEKKRRKFRRSKRIRYEDKFHTENHYTRTKSTKGNGNIEFSEWTLVS
eukprot:gene9709-11923_t